MFRLPTSQERHAIVGSTGSGKTQFANHILSFANWDKRPWLVIDYKGDELIADIPGIEEIGLKEKLPKHRGIYVTRPNPNDNDWIEKRFWEVWKRENTGVYIDEGYMVPDEGGLQACLTQGRSKHIPMIILSQRPAYINRFVFTEADMLSIFRLSDRKDILRVQELMPDKIDRRELPPYHSYFYDVKKDYFSRLLPVPDREEILDRFEARRPKRRIIV